MKNIIIINEQHTLLDNQVAQLGEFELCKIPATGLTLEEQKDLGRKLLEENTYDRIVFCSPIPFLLGWLVRRHDFVAVFHNDNREKKELPNGKVISVTAREGWEVVNV